MAENVGGLWRARAHSRIAGAQTVFLIVLRLFVGVSSFVHPSLEAS